MSPRYSTSSPPPSPLASRLPSPIRSVPMKVADVANIFVKLRRMQSKLILDCSSGEQPLTHPTLEGPGVLSEQQVPLAEEELYICRDGVDLVKLLRAIRATLYERAENLGANVLVKEQWSCTVSERKHHRDGPQYKVRIRYSAFAARSDRRDPQKPVALDRARGIPGLMTVISRTDD